MKGLIGILSLFARSGGPLMRELTAAETTVSATMLGGMSVLQTRSRFATFVICLVAAFQTHAAPLRLRPGWDDLRAIVRHTELSLRIVMRTGPDGKSRIKGKLTGITYVGIAIETSENRRSVHWDATLFVPRGEVRQVQLMPVKGDRFKGHRFGWRKAAAVALVPVGIGAYILGIGTLGGIPGGPLLGNSNTLQGLALGAAVPYVLYRLAWKAERRNGAIFVELDYGR